MNDYVVSPLDYLRANIEEEYRPWPLTWPFPSVNPNKPCPPKCTGFWDYRGIYYYWMKLDEVDGCIIYGLPQSPIHCIEERHLFKLIKWIDSKLFKPMINKADDPETKTEMVRLRIAVNMIMNLTDIELAHRQAWYKWVQELYWNRKKVLNQWYLDYVLPF